MKEKLKAFTLIEVIIVLALFSLIMFSVVQLLDPVSKFFVRSSNYESTNACLDNISRAVEGNLKYADRVWGYWGESPYENADELRNTADPNVQAQTSWLLDDHVEAFYNQFFYDRRFDDVKGKIHVIIFDNTFDENVLNSTSTLNDFQQQKMNQGMVTLLTYDFDTYDTNLDTWAKVKNTLKTEPWYVNQKLYGNFNYCFDLVDPNQDGGIDATTTTTNADGADDSSDDPADPTPTVHAENFAIKITAQEVKKVTEGGSQHLALNTATTNTVANFAMRNVLDANTGYNNVGIDEKLVPVDGAYRTAEDELNLGPTEDAEGRNYTMKEVPRYQQMTTNRLVGWAWKGFYFIYTLPDEIYDLCEDDRFNSDKFVTSPTTAAETTTATS